MSQVDWDRRGFVSKEEGESGYWTSNLQCPAVLVCHYCHLFEHSQQLQLLCELSEGAQKHPGVSVFWLIHDFS